MREIVRILCGSHLYGTDVPSSDRDYKIVYAPSAKRILLQQADKLDPEEMPAIVKRLKKDAGISKDPDVEFMSLKQYLKLLCQGQTNAMDMFFAPQEFYVGMPAPEWYAIQNHERCWISKNSAAFVGYCRQQAGKYAIKIDRYEALKLAVAIFSNSNPRDKIKDICLGSVFSQNPHVEFVNKETAHGTQLSHLSVCETMVPVTASCGLALATFSRKLDEYGKRVEAASNMDEKDWKSMYHAVRVAEEALELLGTGKLTLPRPERRLLTAVRLGKVPFEKVSEMIEGNLKRIEEAVEKSTLPDQPDWDAADRLVECFYGSVVSARNSYREG